LVLVISIAKSYGERLGLHNLQAGALDRLVEEYPSHGFIIDYREAKGLFKEVSLMSAEEVVLVTELDRRGYCTLSPSSVTVFGDVSTLLAESEEDKDEDTKRSAENIGPDGARGAGESEPPPGGGNGTHAAQREAGASQMAPA
jgi:hypothetical protein